MKGDPAWVVSLDDQDAPRSCVVFAQKLEAAHLLGTARLGAQEPEDCSTSRAPEFDEWSEHGMVPPRVLLQNGWHMECHGCGCELDVHAPELVLELGRFLYCSSQCRETLVSRIKEVNDAFREFQERVRESFRALTFVEFKGGWPILTPIARFTFPGSLFGGGRIRQSQDGKLEVSVASGDLSAWERLPSQDSSPRQDA